MQHLNSIQIIGGVVRPAEVKDAANTKVAKVALAVSRRYRAKEGYKEEVCFIDVVVWGEKAANAANLRKGQRIFVSGWLKQENWVDEKTQQKRSKFVIQAESFVHEGELGEDMPILEETPAAKLYNVPDNNPLRDKFVQKEQAPAGRIYKPAPVKNEYNDYNNSDLPF